MAGSPATLLVVSHDRRLLETVCEKLWVVDDGGAAPFDGGYRAWRAAVAAGWTVASALEAEAKRLHIGSRNPGGATATALASAASTGASNGNGRSPRPQAAGPAARPKGRKLEKLSKDAYRRQRTALDGELTRLGLRKSHLELAMGDPGVAANFVELRRVTSELADVDAALAGGRGRLARARGARAVTVRIGLTGPIGCGKSTVAGVARRAAGRRRHRRGPGRAGGRRARRAGARRDRRTVRRGAAPSGRDRSTGPPWVGSSSPTRRRFATSRRSSIPRSGRGSWPR